MLDALLREAAQYNVQIFCNTAVEELLISDGKISGCRAGKREFHAEKLLLAGGGNGYPALGARGLGYRLAASAGHTILTPVPALVGLRTKEEWPTRLAGITVERARAGFGRGRFREGVLLFTKTGVSGPQTDNILPLLGKTVKRRRKGPVRGMVFVGFAAGLRLTAAVRKDILNSERITRIYRAGRSRLERKDIT